MFKKLLLTAFLLFLSVSAHAQADRFEGRITYKMRMPVLGDLDIPMNVYLKGDRVMMGLDLGVMGGMKTYVDSKRDKVVVVMESNKSGFEMKLPKDEPETVSSVATVPEMASTGKSGKINGYHAEEFTAELGDEMTSTFWVSKDVPADVRDALNDCLSSNPQTPQAEKRIFKNLAKKGLAVVKASIAKGPQELASLELAQVEYKKLDDEMFTIPKDVDVVPMNVEQLILGAGGE